MKRFKFVEIYICLPWAYILFWMVWCTYFFIDALYTGSTFGLIVQSIIGTLWYTAAWYKYKDQKLAKIESRSNIEK